MLRPSREQGKWLKQIVTGFFAYHTVLINFRALQALLDHVKDLWRVH
jgi:RNA-directed DNA polymerase